MSTKDLLPAAKRLRSLAESVSKATDEGQKSSYYDSALWELYDGTGRTPMVDYHDLAVAYIAEHPEVGSSLAEALAKLMECQNLIGASWQSDAGCRTPRMAEVVSLLERARSKLQKESRG